MSLRTVLAEDHKICAHKVDTMGAAFRKHEIRSVIMFEFHLVLIVILNMIKASEGVFLESIRKKRRHLNLNN